jgi:hypothetical protein
MYDRTEREYYTAKRKAARQLGVGRAHASYLPSNREIRDEIDTLARLHEGPQRDARLKSMRVAALALMRRLEPFRPRLIGSVLTGHIRLGSDIDIHVFSDSVASVTGALEELGLKFDVEHKRVVKHHEARIFTHIHIRSAHGFELTLYPTDKVGFVFKSSITGKAIERASVSELEDLLRREHPGFDPDLETGEIAGTGAADPFAAFRDLLAPLERVKQSPVYHPEGDALYHSLQVFELARSVRPWDQELLLAALLHDVGKAIDPRDHVAAGLSALEGHITDRTRWLIEHHMEAHEVATGEIGWRALRRLKESEDFDDLMLLRELDDAGRRGGVIVCSIDEALDYLRTLEDDEWGTLEGRGPSAAGTDEDEAAAAGGI